MAMRWIAVALFFVTLATAAMADTYDRAFFGAQVENLAKEDAGKLGLAEGRGVRVVAAVAGSPAEAAGLKTDDVLLSIDGTDLTSAGIFIATIQARSPGTEVHVRILRAGNEQTITAKLGQRRGPAGAPQLMLDTGGHMASVVDVAITPDGKQFVTASNDKTVRVWDIETGKTVRMIRGEAGPGNWGTIYAMALSPDGRWLAIGGLLHDIDKSIATAIKLYDFASGSQVALLKGHDNVVHALAFSPDGARLISGNADKTAIIWDLTTRKALVQLSGHEGRINAVAFSNDGKRAVTGSQDETLRLWNASDGKLIAEMTEHRAIRQRQEHPERLHASVLSVAVSPVAPLIASGSEDGKVLLWDAETGAFARQLAFPGGMVGFEDIKSLSFSPDGRRLLSASAFEGCQIYDVVTGGEWYEGKLWDKPLTHVFSSGDPVQHVHCGDGATYSRDGRLAAVGYNSTINLIDARTSKGTKTLQSAGTTVFGVGIAADGHTIGWGNTVESMPGSGFLHKLSRRVNLPSDDRAIGAIEDIGDEAAAGAREANNYLRASRKHGSWSIDFQKVKGETGLINARYLEISNGDQVQAQIKFDPPLSGNTPFTFTPDGQTVLVGTVPEIWAYDLKGQLRGSFIGHGGQVRDLAVSADGRFLVSGASDQTVRLWNLQTRELIVSLFQGSDGEWVMWTPQGYYASSPNGDRIVGWQINKGPEQAAEYVTASQLRSQFYRPDIVERAIKLASASTAVEQAGRGGFQLSDLTARLPPKLTVTSPSAGEETMRGRAAIALSLAESADDPVKNVDVFVNETKVTAAATRQGNDLSFEVPLGQGTNNIRVVARSNADLIGEAELAIQQNGEGALDKRDTLYVIAVGVDKYPGVCATCDLAFAGADARAFADTVEQQMGKQHLHVVKRVLFNGAGGNLEPTRDNIENVFDVLLQAKDNDTIAVFIAGHGYNDPRIGYEFLPTNARAGDAGNWASSSVIKWTTLEGAIEAAKGRRLLFVDTCHAGSAYNARLIKDASDGGIVAYSATTMQQEALELANLGHGVFTNVLIKGLNGAADLGQEKEVRVFDLGTFVEREVRKLTNGRQTPDFYKKPGAENFVLVRM
jgi:WD40 repeat protein